MIKSVQVVTGSFFYLLGKVLFDYKVYGLEKIQGLEHGPIIFASNHCSFIDGPLTGMALPYSFLPIKFLVAEEYFTTESNLPRGLKWIGPLYTRLNGCIKVYREKDPKRNFQNPLVALSEKGAKIWIFPEGTRGKDGCIKKGHSGVAYLHKYSGAPVVPVFIQGSWGSTVPFQNKISLIFGEPIWHFPKNSLRCITNNVMDAIKALS